MAKFKSTEALMESLRKRTSGIGPKATVATSEACRLLRDDIIQSISHKGSGITYEKYQPRRTHTASAPNMPPATDTGELRRGIGFTVKKVGSEGSLGFVFSNAKHSAALEFGTKDMLAKGGPRPFMGPSLERNRSKIDKIFAKHMVWGSD